MNAELSGFYYVTTTDRTVLVKRSITVRDDDPVYRPVAEFLANSGAVLIERGYTADDDSVAFRRAEISVYAQPASD